MLRSFSGRTLLAAAVAAALTAAQGAHADDQAQPSASAPPSQALQEVVVTAQKRVEKLHDVPMGVTAVTGTEMDRLRLADFQDLQAMVPALSVEQIQPGLSRLTLRGENVGSVGSTVTTYIDDTPFGSSNALANGSIITGDFDTWDLQRVEVLRGPQGTLYGAGSEGGLLKYVTNSPDPTRTAGAFEVGAEDVSHGGDLAPLVKGMVNVPIGSSAALRLSGFDTQLPGYIDDPTLGENNVNRGSREGGRASLLVNATDNFSIRVTVFGQNLRTDGSNAVDVVGAAGNPLAPPANQLQPLNGDYNQSRFIDEPSTFRSRVASTTLDWNLGWGDLTSVSSYAKTYQNQFSDATSDPAGGGFTFGDFASLLVLGLPRGSAGIAETNVINMGKFTQEVRLASSGTRTLDWQVGAFFTREASRISQTLPIFLIPSDVFAPVPSFENAYLGAVYREWSGFGQVTYHFNPQWDIALGARWSENKQSADESVNGLALGGATQLTGGTSSGSDFTYSIAPRWHVTDNTMAYARVATGYRPGGPNALPPGVVGVPTSYQADKTTNYELGTRTSFLDNRLSVDVAAFLIHWQSIQLFEFVNNFGINANGGSAQSKGLEWTVDLAPVEGLNFLLTGAYIDANLTADATAAGGSNGDQLPYAPKWSTSLDSSYSWHAVNDFEGFVGATWTYTGGRISDFAASTSVGATGVVFTPDPRAELPSYSTVNLRAGLSNARWTFELYCRNVGDERGITSYTNQGTPNNGGSIGLIVPRTLGVTITTRF